MAKDLTGQDGLPERGTYWESSSGRIIRVVECLKAKNHVEVDVVIQDESRLWASRHSFQASFWTGEESPGVPRFRQIPPPPWAAD